MNLSHKIRLDPTNKQRASLQKAAGVARYTWNWALSEVERHYRETGKSCNINELKKRWNQEKPEWVYESPKDANQQPFSQLKGAYGRFFKHLGGRPRLKKKGVSLDSFYVSNDKFSVKGKRIRVPNIGWVRMQEELRFEGKIASATFSRDADGWYVSFSVEGEFSRKRTGKKTVGVDLGVKNALTLSTGETLEGPKPLKKHLKRLARLQRKFSKQQKGSKRREKQKKRIAKLHKRIRDIRNDFLHKTTARLCRENQTVVIEDLAVRNMVRNRRLARAISDIGFGEFRRQLQYKAELYGTEIVVADRWFPSSKTCHECGTIKTDLALSERVFRCEHCGYEEDRDVNAAKNLRTLGLRGTKARGLGRRPVVTKAAGVEAGTNQRCRLRSA